MKLVDILARELKVWPENAAYCEGYMHTRSLYFVDANHRIILRSEIQLTLNEIQKVTREQWQAAVDALKASAWDGEGLPPIGVECWYGINNKVRVKVIGHQIFNSKTQEDQAVSQPIGLPFLYIGAADHFSPIRTAEQIEAEEWEKEVVYVMSLMPRSIMTTTEIVQWMISNGYRKQVAK